METVVVSASVGVMKPILAKLTTLMGDEYKMPTEVRKQVPFFKDELSAMSDFLEKLEDYDQLDLQTKGWRDRVREMTFDIEDSIDDLMRQDSNANTGFLEKILHYIKNLKECRQIASQFKKLRHRVEEESERNNRYKIDHLQSSFSIVPVDPRVTALYKDSAGLVGISGPREELIKWLVDMEKQLKVISIVGFGGLGKTTLAKEVYQKIGEQFDCKVFVSVSQRPDLARLLKDILSKLKINCSSSEVQGILDRLRAHFKHKRYFIVVDDLWDMPTWEIISCAFPDNGLGSRVIVTTRVEDVASRTSSNNHLCIYKMKPLNDQDSRRLFLNRIFGSEDGCPSHYKQVCAQILKKCGGLPLAIITIASLLASRPERLKNNEWESIQRSLGRDETATNDTLEGMRQILDLSYKHLPHHLRTCLLYFCKYPEDHEIKRDDVIRQWIAEGFVCTRSSRDREDVAKCYFNELVNRSLIQPERSDCGEVLSCRVHDMMLDLILKRCAENNFISVAYSSEDVARETKYEVRRLSLHCNVEYGSPAVIDPWTITTSSLSKVRSLSLIGSCIRRLPLLTCPHKYLRVLDLQMIIMEYERTANGTSWWPLSHVDLTIISQFLQLRYLKLGMCAQHITFPGIISGLVHLETLEILGNASLPSDVAELPRLSRLVVDYHMDEIVLNGLGKMTSLRTLAGFSLQNLDTKALGDLANLRDLRLSCGMSIFGMLKSRNLFQIKWLSGDAFAIRLSDPEAKGIGSLWSSIGKLRSLRYLEIRPWGCVLIDDINYLGSLSNPPPSIEILNLKGFRSPRIPQWIRAGALDNLRRLELLVSRTSTDEVAALGELPSLVHFVLELEGGPRAVDAIVFGTGFIGLESLCFYFYDADATSYMGFQFQAGVMPNLRRLTLQFDHREWSSATPVGMEHLLGLQHVHVEFQNHQKTLEGYPPPSTFYSDAEGALRNIAEAHPGRPSFTLEWCTRQKRKDIFDSDPMGPRSGA